MSAPGVQPAELDFFVALTTAGSLSAAARNLGITTPAVSKRLVQMEARIGMPLVMRTTRRMNLTPEGEVFLERARRILGEIDDLGQLPTQAKGRPSGLLRVNTTLGFGRMHIASAISEYVKAYPDVDVQSRLSADPPPLNEDLFDVCVRFDKPPDARIAARKVASNRRLLCASPAHLRERGTPVTSAELARHNCIGICQGSDAYGAWRLASGKGAKHRTETVCVRSNLTTNDGEITVNWALKGHGIAMRAQWDIERYLKNGRLVQVLSQYATPEADVYAVYHQRRQLSSRIRLFVGFLVGRFEKTRIG